MNDRTNFFHVKNHALGALLAWGLANVLIGAVAALSRNLVVRHLGLQSLVWGAIDAALGFAGQRSARAAIARGDSGEQAAREARRDSVILLINTGLDIGYVAGGIFLTGRAAGRAERVGAGVGIAIQGLFLLLFDSSLAWLFRRWSGSKQPSSLSL